MANLITQWTHINGIRKTELTQTAREFNKPTIGPLQNIAFNGTMSDVYKWEQQITAAIQLKDLPKGTHNQPQTKLFNGVAINLNGWGTVPQTWQLVTYNAINPIVPANAGVAALPATIATYAGQHPPLAQQVWTNPLLDGIEIVEGNVQAHIHFGAAQNDPPDPTDPRSVTHSYPELRGKYAVGAGATTAQFQPANTCERSRHIINQVLSGFRDNALSWITRLIQENPNSIPRTFHNHKWEGQAPSPTGKYGLFAMVRERFIPASVKTAVLGQLEQMNIYNYERPISGSGRTEMRNMASFIEAYKEALYISEVDYGSIEHQRLKFLSKIDQQTATHIQTRISDSMGPPHNHMLTMNEIYIIATNFSVNMKYGAAYANEVYNFLQPHGDTRFIRKRFTHNINTSKDDELYNPYEQYGIHNTNIVKTMECFGCGEVGHMKKECPNKVSTPTSKGMRKAQNKSEKIQDKYWGQTQNQQRSYNNYRQRSRSRSRSRGRYNNNKNNNYRQRSRSRSGSRGRSNYRRRSPSPYWEKNNRSYWKTQNNISYPPNQTPRHSNTHDYYYQQPTVNNVSFDNDPYDIDQLTRHVTNMNINQQDEQYNDNKDFPLIDLD